MNPIGFEELGALAQMRDPSIAEIEAADPTACLGRGDEGTSRTGKTAATCAVLTAATDRTVAVDRTVCKVCICNGVAIVADNAALRKHVLQTAYSATMAGRDALEPAAPDDPTLWAAVDNVKQWAGAEIAKRFVDTLVYHESVTPQKAVDILDEHGLAEAE